ncbi:MAG TPA: pyridoxal phosphate-dependent aminotransferase [Vicinamibacterales bacterium]
MFSRRVPDDRTPNRLAQAAAAALSRGPLVDLTLSNPTLAGLSYPPDLLRQLSDAAALTYRPEPLGLRSAREAVSATYFRRGLRVGPDRIVLTASTSEAYSVLFKLLCEPARSSVLTPVPSYPLFDHLTRLDGVGMRRYALDYQGVWSLRAGELGRAWSADTRAVLAVSPNNPTGSIVREPDAAELINACAARSAALIVDEVFWEYPLEDPLPEPASFSGPPCLLFRLGGLSKSAGLPQVKLGWIAVDGPSSLVADALDRLELICDSYLSVSTSVQVAAPELIERGRDIRDQIAARVRGNYQTLRERIDRAPGVTALRAEGGWSAVLRVPATATEEQLALDLLGRHAVVVHPGYFFDFPHEAFLIVSLLPAIDTFVRGIDAILEYVRAA